MKKLFIFLALGLAGCSTDSTTTKDECHYIITRGEDTRGKYLILDNNKRYKVLNMSIYDNMTELCEPINLTEQPL
ncbi:MAG: hypothetical protein RLZZ605_1444 [Bacteroidota bacterium]|jgi:ABC-type Fe3+-citrate transport system substrate-binding protein